MRQKWGIVMVSSWETDNAWVVYEGMNTMAERVGSELGSRGQGDEWVRSALGGTEFVRWPNSRKPSHPILLLTGIHTLINRMTGGKTPWQHGPTGLALPAHYPLLDNDADTIYFFDPMDETTPVHESGHIIDYRNDYVSGDMARIVIRNESPTNYGTTNQIEDFAESWRYWIYNEKGLMIDRQTFIENLVIKWR